MMFDSNPSGQLVLLAFVQFHDVQASMVGLPRFKPRLAEMAPCVEERSDQQSRSTTLTINESPKNQHIPTYPCQHLSNIYPSLARNTKVGQTHCIRCKHISLYCSVGPVALLQDMRSLHARSFVNRICRANAFL